jgi:xanthine/uracil permease
MANGNDTSTGWNWAGFIAIVLGGVALVWTLGRGVSGSFAVLVGYIIGLFAAIVLARMLSGRIDLQFLISDDNGHASTSRFQFILFSFVIASAYFLGSSAETVGHSECVGR